MYVIAWAGLSVAKSGMKPQSITFDECKLSCKVGTPKYLKGNWTCVDHRLNYSAPELTSSSDKPWNVCEGIFGKCNIVCQNLNDCRECCGRTLAPLCIRNACACF